MVSIMGSPAPCSVILAQSAGGIDHFPRVADALRDRGLAALPVPTGTGPFRVSDGTAVVVVADTESQQSRYLLRQAHACRIPTVLLMDGILEWRNTFCNGTVPPDFLRPAPVDVVACAGEVDRALLEAWGNTVIATGLPRLGKPTQNRIHGDRSATRSLLIATARHPWFTLDERARLLESLRRLAEAAVGLGLDVRWRIATEAAEELGLVNDVSLPLNEILASVDAVITTPSTLLIEAMQSGLPTCLLNPFGTPCWQQAAWQTDGHSVCEWQTVLSQLAEPESLLVDRQRLIIQRLHASDEDPAETLASALANLAEAPRSQSATGACVKGSAPLSLAWPKPTKPRVISCIVCDGSPVGGVTNWSVRLAREFARRDLPYDVRTVLIGIHADACDRSLLIESDHDHDLITSLIVDPTLDQVAFLDQLRGALEDADPSIILPNYADFCYAAAMQLRAGGVRTVAAVHSDDWYYRQLTRVYHDWDAAVGVSATIARWLAAQRGEAGLASRPVHRIPYGIPIANVPRTHSAGCDSAPISLAYIGRMVNYQKRLDSFIPFARHLVDLGASFHLHMVGDGPDVSECRDAMKTIPLDSATQSVTWHGRRSPQWTQRLLREQIDVSILLSDFEGTSITMLEAMGQGVVPAVTGVDSGVGEWVEDDVTGIVVDVGRPDVMAQRIANLTTEDVNRLGRAAWETVRQRQAGLDVMADRYRAVFDEVMSAGPVLRPVSFPALGWSLTDGWRWPKTWADHPSDDRACITRQLQAAGCAQIIDGYPSDEAPAVTNTGPRVAVIDGVQGVPLAETRRRWQSDGIGTIILPTLLAGREADNLTDQISRMGAALDTARTQGATRIVLYGVGLHTRRLRDVLQDEPEIVGFIDDGASGGDGQTFWDRPVCPVDAVIKRVQPDAVILSSDDWEYMMWEKCEPLREQGIPVYALYGSDQSEQEERQRKVVVSTIFCDPTPVGGVTFWSLRMSQAFAHRPQLGYDCHTLLLCPAPMEQRVREFADAHAGHEPSLQSLVHVVPLDFENCDHIEILEAVRRAVEALGPDIVLPNYTDLTHAAATQIRQGGEARMVAASHTDDPYYRKLLQTYDRWDAAVGVSASCMGWINQLADGTGRATRQIVYGVPSSAAPRSVNLPDKPLQLAYVGRMVQHQKRVFEFVELVKRLEALGTEYRLHMVGDGPDLEKCRTQMNRADRVIWHGSQSSDWVQDFWPTVDVAVLLSEFEGTSITMLEAMAHGVVPAVTAVHSGVSEWVEDGAHGVVVPCDDSPADAMALRLHALSLDRAHLARMGTNAWQRIHERQLTIDHMAEQYAALFDDVPAGEIGDGLPPTDTSLRLTDRTRWIRPTSNHPEHVNARLREWLTEAGYGRIVELEYGQSPDTLKLSATDSSTAVIVHTQGAGTAVDDDWFATIERAATRWRDEWGIGVVFSPHLFERPELEPHGTILRALRRAVAGGRQRIVLYGTGKHTQRLLSVVTEGGFPIVGFMDDNPPPDMLADGLAGLPVVRADTVFDTLNPDCIILSSDAWERQMWQRCQQMKAESGAVNVAVMALYGEYENGHPSRTLETEGRILPVL